MCKNEKVFSASLWKTVLLTVMLLLAFSMSAFAASRNETESNNTFDSANYLDPGDTVYGVIDSYDDEDYYKITPTSNGKLDMTFIHSYENSSDDWRVFAYSYENGQYTEFMNWRVELSDNERIRLPFIGMKANQTYYIMVERCCSGVEGKQYTLETAFSSSAYYEKELNDSYGAATKANLDHTYTGVINHGDDVDCYKIVPSANGKIDLTFKHSYVSSSDDWDVYVYRYGDGEYVELSSTNIDLDSNEECKLPFIGAVKNATYYVVVKRCCSGVVGKNYQLKLDWTESAYIEKELNNTYNSASKMTIGKSYKGTIGNYYDDDYYKIVPDANGKLSISFNYKYADTYDDWDVYVYRYSNGEYTELESYNFDLNGKEKNNLAPLGVVKNGTYFIRVSRCCGGVVGKEYTIKTSLNKTAYYEKEVNNTYAKATSIKPNKKYSGNANNSRDEDYFKIVAPAKGKLTVSFNHAYVDSYADWSVYLYEYRNGSYNQLNYAYVYMKDKKFTFDTINVRAKGTYYIVVSCSSSDVIGKNYDIVANFNILPVKSLSSSATKSSVKLSWKKNGSADGYEVQRKSGDSFKKLTTTTSTSYKNTGLSANKSYKYRVRSYRTINKVKYYSNWKTISVKTKK